MIPKLLAQTGTPSSLQATSIMTDLIFLKTEFLLNNINSVHISEEPVNAIYCENHTRLTNILYGQNAEFQFVKAGDTHTATGL
jgi:hypothetical protein